MSRWLPRLVEGLVHNPLGDVRWNAAELRVERAGPAEPVLLSATAGDSSQVYVVSHNALPEQRDLILEVHLRTDAPPRRVQLERFALPGPGGGKSRVCVYRIAASSLDTTPLPAPPMVVPESAARVERPRGFEAEPSMY